MIKRMLKRTLRWDRSRDRESENSDEIPDYEEANLATVVTSEAVTNGEDSFMIRCRDPMKWNRIVAYSRAMDVLLLNELGQHCVRCVTKTPLREELIRLGCIDIFNGMLTGNMDYVVHELAMTCLAYLSVFPKYRPLLIEKDLLDIILPNMGYNQYNLQLQTVKCIANLSIDKNVAHKVYKKGGLVSIMQLFCLPLSSSSLELKAECLSTIACLSRLADIARDLVMIGALVPIIDCLWLVEGVAYIDAPWHRSYDPPRPEEAQIPLYKKIATAACQCMRFITFYVDAKQLYFDLRAPYVLLSYAMSANKAFQKPASAAVNTFRLTLGDFKQQELNLLDRTYENLQQEYQVSSSIIFLGI